MKIPENIKSVVRIVRQLGGQSYLVGGVVVDILLGLEPKDWDLEVFGITLPVLQKELEDRGLNPRLVGKEFGVLKINNDGLDIDISLPRRDNKVGVGHTDFEVFIDPSMTPVEAAKRRDLTINSMLYGIENDQIIDPFGGVEDLRAGVIKATDPELFVEDPLRVLRIMQLLPRKGKVVESETLELCKSLVETFDSLSAERVMVEFEKLLLRAKEPSLGLRFLRDSGWVKHFPELENLIGCLQNPVYHPEGDAWEHTLIVVDNAAIVREWVPEEWRLAFMFGALLHDVGKPSTTIVEENFSAKGHDKAGEPLTKGFMKRLTSGKELTDRVMALVRLHMHTYYLTHGKAKAKSWRRLHNKCRLDVLGWLSLCDRAAAIPEILGDPHDRALNAWKYFFELGSIGEAIKPKLLGRHLIAVGLQPGPVFGKCLKAAYEAQLDDDNLELNQLLKVAIKEK